MQPSSLWHRNRDGSAQDSERRLDSTTASTSGRLPTPAPAESPPRPQWQRPDQGTLKHARDCSVVYGMFAAAPVYCVQRGICSCFHSLSAASRTKWQPFGNENAAAGNDGILWREVPAFDDSPQRSPVSRSALRAMTNQQDVCPIAAHAQSPTEQYAHVHAMVAILS